MGRPPIGKTRMSGAERIRRWRERHGLDKKASRSGDTERLEARIRELEAELIDLKLVLESWNPVIKNRASVMPLAVYQRILSCLHPDSRLSASEDKLAQAFRGFYTRRFALVSEAEMPTPKVRLTPDEMRALRDRAARERKARRAAKEAGRAGSSASEKKPRRHLGSGRAS
jgi:hypothetical protein